MKQQNLEKSKEYKYGFTTDIERVKDPKGLNEEVIRFISKIKKEPKLQKDHGDNEFFNTFYYINHRCCIHS